MLSHSSHNTSLESTLCVKYSRRLSTWFRVVTNANLYAALVKILPEENRLLIQTAHTIDLTYLVHKNSPRWRLVCTEYNAPNGEIGNFFKEFRCYTNTARGSKWDNEYTK
jgi:hypothetical protein